jgi:hypothetical protein
MRSDNRAIDGVPRPIDRAPGIGVLLEARQDPIPDPRFLPAVEPAGHRPPWAIAVRQIAPRSTGLENPENTVDDPSMVMVGSTNARLLWWEKLLQALPLRFG